MSFSPSAPPSLLAAVSEVMVATTTRTLCEGRPKYEATKPTTSEGGASSDQERNVSATAQSRPSVAGAGLPEALALLATPSVTSVMAVLRMQVRVASGP